MCTCFYCVNDITDDKLEKGTHLNALQLLDEGEMSYSLENIDEMIDLLKEYWDFTNQSDNDPLSYDLSLLHKRSCKLMKSIADLKMFPCINLVRGTLPAEFVRIFLAMGRDIRDNRAEGHTYISCKECSDKGICPHAQGF